MHCICEGVCAVYASLRPLLLCMHAFTCCPHLSPANPLCWMILRVSGRHSRALQSVHSKKLYYALQTKFVFAVLKGQRDAAGGRGARKQKSKGGFGCDNFWLGVFSAESRSCMFMVQNVMHSSLVWVLCIVVVCLSEWGKSE